MDTSPSCMCTCDSSDSALSTTANIISIITLAYVLLIGLVYRIAVYQRAKKHSSAIRVDATALRTKLNTMKNQRPNGGDQPMGATLEKADEQLKAVERSLSLLPEQADVANEKWYMIWRQLTYARKRDNFETMLNTVKVQLAFYSNYETLEKLVQERKPGEDPAVTEERRALRGTVAQGQAEAMALGIPVDIPDYMLTISDPVLWPQPACR